MSNPRTFVISDRTEVAEKESNNDQENAQPLEFGTIVNAVSNGAADVDFYKIHAAANQRILITAEAQRIDSRMQVQLELRDAQGRRLERSRSGYRSDPVLDYTAKSEGDYYLRVTEFTYRGGIEYFYRLHLKSGPHVDFILPPSGVAGANSKYTLYGRNLPGGVPSGMKIEGIELEKIDVNIPLPKQTDGLAILENLSPEESGSDCFSYRFGFSARSVQCRPDPSRERSRQS